MTSLKPEKTNNRIGLRRFKPYPAYKDSGVEWLREIPAHWESRKLKHVASVCASNVDKKSVDGQTPVRLCNYVDVYYNDYIVSDIKFMNATASTDQIEDFGLKDGDVVLTKDSESWDDIAVPALVRADLDDLVCGYHLAIVRAKEEVASGEYLFRAIGASGINNQFQVAANGITRFGVSRHGLSSALIPLPPVSEQGGIARFLDRETAKIDALVAKKERLTELLQEKRTALITHAVTKGLDPSVPMKDSGVEWLGKIPEHWETRKLKHMASIRASNVDKKTVDGQQSVRLCNYVNVYHNDYIYADIEFMNATASRDQIEEFRLKSGDVVVTKDSESWDDIAVPALVRVDLEDLICGYHLAIVRAKVDVADGEYVFRAIGARGINDQFRVAANGITRFGLPRYGLASATMPMLPLKEQVEIGKYLDQETVRIDGLEAKIHEAIERLKEYRTALISAAVTGKIDVREEVS